MNNEIQKYSDESSVVILLDYETESEQQYTISSKNYNGIITPTEFVKLEEFFDSLIRSMGYHKEDYILIVDTYKYQVQVSFL